MEKNICDFIEYLHEKKNVSHNTEISYQRDTSVKEKKKITHLLLYRGISRQSEPFFNIC